MKRVLPANHCRWMKIIAAFLEISLTVGTILFMHTVDNDFEVFPAVHPALCRMIIPSYDISG